MAEPFSTPTKEQVKETIVFLKDPIGFFLMKCAKEAMERYDPHDFDVMENQTNEWIWLSKRLIWKFGWVQISMWIDKLAEEDAEEYWRDWKPPEIKKKTYDRKMLPTGWKSG